METTYLIPKPKGAYSLFRSLFLVLMIVLGVFAVSLAIAPAASATCPKGQVCGGGGGDTSGPPGAETPSPGGGGTPSPGSGGTPTGPVDPYAFSVWNPADGGAMCPVRDDGKSPYGYFTFFTYLHENTSSADTPPDTSGWDYIGFFRGGGGYAHSWQKMIMTGYNCVYPPRTRIDIVPCYISTTVSLNQIVPTNRVVGTKTRDSGFTAGSSDYDACVNSNTRVSFGSGLPAYGFYNIGASSWIQNVSVEIALGVDPMTGVVPAPKIIGWAPAYPTGFVVTSTASLHCTVGFESPGIWRSDWTDQPCINVSYVCPVEKLNIDVSDPGKTPVMRTFSSYLQLMRDGEARELRFGLGTIHGSSIKVTSHQTRFLRAGTPWDNSKGYNKNLFELSQTSTGSSMLSYSSGTETAWKAGKINSVFTRGYYASEFGEPTKVTQEVRWTGTRTVRSGVVNTVDPVSGEVTYTPQYLQVPTSGLCSQTATLDYVRPVGHEAG